MNTFLMQKPLLFKNYLQSKINITHYVKHGNTDIFTKKLKNSYLSTSLS